MTIKQGLFFSSLLLSMLLAGMFSSGADAQTAIGLHTTTEAEGFRISEAGRLHLFTNLDLRFDTNVGYSAPGDVVGDMALRARGGLKLHTPSERLELSVGGHVDWTQYLGLTSRHTRRLSGLQGQADVGLLANKNGAMTFFFSDSFSRINGPANSNTSERLLYIKNFAQVGTDLRPGGRALEFNFSYALDFSYFDLNQTSVADPRTLTSYTQMAHFAALWRFFPKTAATLEADAAFTRYPMRGTAFTNPSANPVKAQLGATGLITEKLSVRLKAGFGHSVLMPSTATGNFVSVIGTAQATWKMSEFATLAGGYVRDFAPVSFFGWFTFDRVFVEYQHLLFSRFIINLRAQYMYQTYGGAVVAGTRRRFDNVVLGEARFTYQVRSWFAGGVYYTPEVRFSSFVSPTGRSSSYVRHVSGLDFTLAY